MIKSPNGSERFGFLFFMLRWVYGPLLILAGLSALATLSCKIELVNGAIAQSCDVALEQSRFFIFLAAVQILCGFLILVPRTTRLGVYGALILFAGVIIKLLLEMRMDAVWINVGIVVGLLLLARLVTVRQRSGIVK